MSRQNKELVGEVLIKKPVANGGGACIYVPKRWLGYVIRLEVIDIMNWAKIRKAVGRIAKEEHEEIVKDMIEYTRNIREKEKVVGE